MSNWLIIFLYIIAVYGLSNMMVFGSGPFRIFEHIREITSSISRSGHIHMMRTQESVLIHLTLIRI